LDEKEGRQERTRAGLHQRKGGRKKEEKAGGGGGGGWRARSEKNIQITRRLRKAQWPHWKNIERELLRGKKEEV